MGFWKSGYGPSKIGMTRERVVKRGDQQEKESGNPGLAGLGQAHCRSLGCARDDKESVVGPWREVTEPERFHRYRDSRVAARLKPCHWFDSLGQTLTSSGGAIGQLRCPIWTGCARMYPPDGMLREPLRYFA
jgi:hypothetical protein